VACASYGYFLMLTGKKVYILFNLPQLSTTGTRAGAVGLPAAAHPSLNLTAPAQLNFIKKMLQIIIKLSVTHRFHVN